MVIDEQPFLTSAELRTALEAVSSIQYFSAGEKIFGRGEPVRGVFLIRSGKVRLSIAETRQVRNAGPRSALGLPATIASTVYTLSARAIDNTNLSFVPREEFMRILEEGPDLCLEVVRMLGIELEYVHRAMLGELPAKSAILGPARKGPVLRQTTTNPPGLERARKLLAELKAQYDRLPHASRSAIREELRMQADACATTDESNEPAGLWTRTAAAI